MSVDDRGTRAAARLQQEIVPNVDAAAALHRLHDTPAKRTSRLRRRPIVIAFAATAAIVIALAVVVRMQSEDHRVAAGSRPYAYLPAALPSGSKPVAELVQRRAATTSDVRGVQYVATATHISVAVITSYGDALDGMRAFAPASSGARAHVHGHDARLYQVTSAANVQPVPRGVVWKQSGTTIDVWSVGLTDEELLEVARSAQRADRAEFLALVSGLPEADLGAFTSIASQ